VLLLVARLPGGYSSAFRSMDCRGRYFVLHRIVSDIVDAYARYEENLSRLMGSVGGLRRRLKQA